ncbi:UNVERIFIED_CONTAM: hypothetical protein FKN15_067172 [Acipenser sinensis]
MSAGRVTYGGSVCGRPYDPKEMESIEELIRRINRNTAAQKEQTMKMERELRESGWAPLERRVREPTELELLLQKWEQVEEALPAREAPESPAPESPALPEPRGEEPPLPEPRGEEPPLPEPRGEEPPLPEPRGEEAKSIPPPQPRPPPLRSSLAPLRPVPRPLLLDTLPVFLDLPALGLEPRSLHHRPQLCPRFPTPLSPSTQTSLVLPLFAAKLPLGDRTSLRRSPGEDLCPLLQPPVPQPSLRSPLSSQWGPVSPVHGPFLEAPEIPTHPQGHLCKRVKIDICGLEGGWLCFRGGGGLGMADQCCTLEGEDV